MNISRYIFLSLFLILTISTQQATGQDNTIVKDFNKDKSFDFLVKGMGWLDIDSWDYVLTDGKTGKRWGYVSSINYFGAASFMSIGKTRNELGDGWNVIKTIEDTLINFRTKPDPSLEWVLNTEVVDNTTTNETIFDRVVRYRKIWYPGEPLISQNYTYQLKLEDLRHMDAMDTLDTYYWHYRSHNHTDGKKTLEKMDLEGQIICKSKHGIVAFEEGRYAWVFMSGVEQTGGPAKLRWASIEKVDNFGGLLILQQAVVVGEYSFWIGDIQKGIWAKLRNLKESDDFVIEGKDLIIQNQAGTAKKYSLRELQNEIKAVNEDDPANDKLK